MRKLVHEGMPPAILGFGLIVTLAWMGLFGFGLFKFAQLVF